MATYETFEQARVGFMQMCEDVRGDYGDEGEAVLDGGAARDLVVATALDSSDDAARELCRTELGYTPHELVARLGQVADEDTW